MLGFRIPVSVYLAAAIFVIVAVLLFGRVERMRGFDEARSQCDAAALASKNASLQRDLDAARKSEALATAQNAELAAREQTLDKRIDDYEKELHSAKPVQPASAAGTCPAGRVLTDADAKRLRDVFQ